ncbi:MAG: Aldose 1-epimerase family protein YeaD [uncultured Sulfurovum sp.]|uniref:Putative glucose-6-phosphate 1-epimerase n=1 Tax=uncultured Sulfurovum sp. TaxID=269237 RepID=A0A6S6SLM2_9BACT|nr:MAG: Aldose 1-epimerase family protein YeaD [uncultured Sulfurovum sp.]
MITYKKLDNGFEYLEVQNEHAEAKIALQGAHIFHYQTKGEEPLLWLSEKAYFQEGKAIRGGVPICFPWFGPHKYDATLPQHGFARNQEWSYMAKYELSDGATHVQLMLTPNEETRALWEYNFVLVYDVIVGKELTLELTTINSDTEPFDVTQALHTYLNVSDIENVSVQGLEETVFYNSLDGSLEKQQSAVTIKEEVDRVYFDGSSKVTLEDKEREIILNQSGSNSLVVWNPWKEKSETMADMSNDGYKTMLCLETANAHKDFVLLNPNDVHTLKVTIWEKN